MKKKKSLSSLFISPTWKTVTKTMHRVRHHPAIREVISWWVDSLVISQAQWPTSKAKYPVLHFSARHPTEDIALELVVKNLPASTGDIRDAGLIPWSGRSSGGGNGNPLQYCCLENPKDRGAWQATAVYSPWGCKVSHKRATNTFTLIL